jgi:hypothetical protein
MKNPKVVFSESFKNNVEKVVSEILKADRYYGDGLISGSEQENKIHQAFITFSIEVLRENCK